MFQDNIYCHVVSGLGAGLFAVICGSPVDVVKSRMMGAACYIAESPLGVLREACF
jgi:solute carrier family 25 uncoupling protein 8/9